MVVQWIFGEPVAFAYCFECLVYVLERVAIFVLLVVLAPPFVPRVVVCAIVVALEIVSSFAVTIVVALVAAAIVWLAAAPVLAVAFACP